MFYNKVHNCKWVEQCSSNNKERGILSLSAHELSTCGQYAAQSQLEYAAQSEAYRVKERTKGFKRQSWVLIRISPQRVCQQLKSLEIKMSSRASNTKKRWKDDKRYCITAEVAKASAQHRFLEIYSKVENWEIKRCSSLKLPLKLYIFH